MLDSEAAEDVLTYLETYEYASAEHVTLSLLWHTMMRRGAAHGLDVDDYHPEDRCLEVVHRPERSRTLRSRTASVASGWWPSLETCVIFSTTGSGNVDPT